MRSSFAGLTVILVLILGTTIGAAGAAEEVRFPSLNSHTAWLKHERIRGTLFHNPEVGPMFERHLQRPAHVPSGIAPSFDVIGETYVVLLPDSGVVAAKVEGVQGSSSFALSIYALYDEAGNEVRRGVVRAGEVAEVRADGMAGPCTLLVNSGPALRNTARIQPETHFWAIDTRPHSAYDATPLHYHFLRDLRLGGFNLAIVDFEFLEDAFETDAGLASWSAKVKRWTDYARRVGLRVMPSINLGGSEAEVKAWGDARPGLYINPDPSLPTAPCPLDRNLWENVYLSRGREVARMSIGNPFIVGFSLDPEMYQCWIYGHYMDTGTCFCDRCFGGFLKSRGLSTTVLKKLTTGRERYDWLNARGRYAGYEGYLEDRMAGIARWCRKELQQINPNLLHCMFVMEIGNWFCRGMARGLGRPGVPAVNFAETTYYGVGYDPAFLKRTVRDFERWGAHVIMGSAIWDRYFPGTESRFLAAHGYNLATRCQGYFYWPGDHLYQDWGSESAFYDRVAWWDDFWPALTSANGEIDATMADPGRVSALDKYSPVPWKDAWDYKHDRWNIDKHVARIEHRNAHVLTFAAPVTLYLRTTRSGSSISIRARTRGDSPSAVISLIDPSGVQVSTATVNSRKDTALDIGEVQAGVWTIRLDGRFTEVGMDLSALDTYISTSADSLPDAGSKPAGLIGYWPLDEGRGSVLHDKSHRPHFDGSMEGAEWTGGAVGKALKFNGEAGSAAVSLGSLFHCLRQFSFTARVRLDAFPTAGNGATIVNKGPEIPAQHVRWWIGYPPDYPLILELGNETHEWGTGFSTDALTWKTGRWYNLAVTFSSEGGVCTVRHYRDGVMIGESTQEDDLHSGTYDLLIGTYGGLHWIDGAIDEVKFYDVVLSADQIRAESGRDIHY